MLEARCAPSAKDRNTTVTRIRSLHQEYAKITCVHTYNTYTGCITMSIGKLPRCLYIDVVKGLAEIIDQIDSEGAPKHEVIIQLTD